MPLTLLTGGDEIAFDLGRTPRPRALHVPLVPNPLRDSFIFSAPEVLVGRCGDWRRGLRLMGNRLCWVLFLEEVERISCRSLCYRLLRLLSLSDDARRMVTRVDLGQVLQGALRARTRTDWVVQKVQKVHLLFSFLWG